MHGRNRTTFIAALAAAFLGVATAVALAAGRPDTPRTTPTTGTTPPTTTTGPAGPATTGATTPATADPANAGATTPTTATTPAAQSFGTAQGDQEGTAAVGQPAPAQVTPAAGTVTVVLPGTTEAVPLTAVENLPAGTVIDATSGGVTLDGPNGRPGTFTGGAFVVRETTGRNARVVIQLVGGDFSVCKGGRRRAGALRAAGRRHVIRRVWGRDNHGRFGTQGRDATASVRGTVWLTEDTCEGTRFTVRQGAIVVRGRRGQRAHVVRAGASYLVAHRR
jgi:hypothetical protein